MEYNFVVTDETTVIHDISLQTTLPETINLFGIKVEVPYDTSKLVLTDISGNNYTWSFPFDSSDFPDVVPNAFASAYFLDASGNSEEIKELIDASNLTFTATSTSGDATDTVTMPKSAKKAVVEIAYYFDYDGGAYSSKAARGEIFISRNGKTSGVLRVYEEVGDKLLQSQASLSGNTITLTSFEDGTNVGAYGAGTVYFYR